MAHVDKDRANEGMQKFSGLIQITVIFISLKMLLPQCNIWNYYKNMAILTKRRGNKILDNLIWSSYSMATMNIRVVAPSLKD